MIPHERTAPGPDGKTRIVGVLDVAGVARVLGIEPGTMSNTTPHLSADFPARLNPLSARIGLLWDQAQVEAYRQGKRGNDLPPLPPQNELDLLDDREAAAAAGVTLNTWRSYARKTLTGATAVTTEDGKVYWLRGTIRCRNAAPPGQAGRPVGAKDAIPRRRRGVDAY